MRRKYTPFSVDPQSSLEMLATRARNGDGRAWAALVDRFQNLVYSVPRRMGLGNEDAADVFQNTFLALHRNLDRIENIETLPRWLAVTAARESFRLINARKNKPSMGLSDSGLDALIAEEDRAIDEQIHLSSMGEVLQQGLAKLQERCRELLKMLYADDDVSYIEISERLSVPLGSIGPTRARCLEKLRTVLRKDPAFSGMYQDHDDLALPV